MASIDQSTGEARLDADQSPLVNADAGVVVGTPVQNEAGNWRAFILKDGLLFCGVFKCDDAIEKGDVVMVKFKDAAASRGTLKKVA